MFDVSGDKRSGEYCVGCGTRLALGKFAYNQELCWDCFEQKVAYIIKDLKTTDDKEIIKHLLNITKLFAAKWR